MSIFQESMNCIDISSDLMFPCRQRLSGNSSCMTSRFVSVDRAGDPFILPVGAVGVRVKDHTKCTAEWQIVGPVKHKF